MRELRFVEPGAEGDHVIVETTDAGEQFMLPISADLLSALPAGSADVPDEADVPEAADLPEAAASSAEEPVEEVAERETPAPTANQPPLSPRDIQVRVRAGADPEHLAAEHAMDLDKVMRFAGPVLHERLRVADEARRARARRSAGDASAVVFGEAVDARFNAYGIDPSSVRWDGRRRDDGQWIVTAYWLGGDSEQQAQWSFLLSARTVAPLDEAAVDLLSDRPIRAVVRTDIPRSTSRADTTRLGPGVVAFPAMPEAHTGPLPVVDDVYDQDAPDPDAPRVSRPSRAAARHRRTAEADSARAAQTTPTAQRDNSFDAPPLPLGIAVEPATPTRPDAHDVLLDELLGGQPSEVDDRTDPAADAEPEQESAHVTNLGIARREDHSRRSGKPKMPSWDDIMLGVRRKSD